MKLKDKFEIELPEKHASRIQTIKEYLDKKIIIETPKRGKNFEGILKQGTTYGYYHLLLANNEEYIFNIDEKLRFYLPNF
jgi:small nuclear ribonucleoprotein (snRNP)-like protein